MAALGVSIVDQDRPFAVWSNFLAEWLQRPIHTRRKGRNAAGHDDGAVWATIEPTEDHDCRRLICAGLNEVVQLQPGETVITHTPDWLRFTPVSRKLCA